MSKQHLKWTRVLSFFYCIFSFFTFLSVSKETITAKWLRLGACGKDRIGTSVANNKLQTPAPVHSASLSPERLKCFDMHLTAHASMKCPFSKSNILHFPLLMHLLAAAIHQRRCCDSRGSEDAEGRRICIWNGRMQMIVSGSPDRAAKGE